MANIGDCESLEVRDHIPNWGKAGSNFKYVLLEGIIPAPGPPFIIIEYKREI